MTTTEERFTVAQIVDSIDRLHELVLVSTDGSVRPGDKILEIVNGNIRTPIDWFDTEPPYRYPEMRLTDTRLLALIFDKMENQQRAFQLLSEDDALYPHLLAATNLRFGYEFTEDLIQALGNSLHNLAIVYHYGQVPSKKSLQELQERYVKALETTSDLEMRLYTAKHYLNLLMDGGLYEEAVEAANAFIKEANTSESILALKIQLCQASFKNLRVPYSKKGLSNLLGRQSECISDLEEKELQLNAALLAMEACDVANFMGDFPMAKTYVNKAIQYFKAEDITDFLGEAGLKKAHLLYRWSKHGSPQYYKSAINAFQDTLKVFKRDLYPGQFAEVQHNLALIYSEMPATDDEKPIWTAFSASAFKEALGIYTKEAHPYEYAMVCHNYATALMDFPKAKLHDNYKKAYDLFEAALEIRTAKAFPVERAITLSNQLELCWLIHNTDSIEEEKRYTEMKAKSEEIEKLVQDGVLLSKAKDHLRRLEQLKEII